MNNLIIYDIDGVLADCTHRLHYLEEKKYEEFYSDKILDDRLIREGVVLFNRLWKLQTDSAIFLTGRPCMTRELTKSWLRGNFDARLGQYPLLMRGDEDHRPSPIVKTELLRACNIPFEEYDAVYYIDDDPENVKAVCKAFPKITGITFGIKRMEKK